MKHIVPRLERRGSVSILQNIAKSAKTGAKVLLVESVVEAERGIPSMSKGDGFEYAGNDQRQRTNRQRIRRTV